jgi:hypothetical protein
MAFDRVVFDEFHLTFHTPAQLSGAAVSDARRVLNQFRFRRRLRRLVRRLIRSYPALAVVTVLVSR